MKSWNRAMLLWLSTRWRCWLALKGCIVWKMYILQHNSHSQPGKMLSLREEPREQRFSPPSQLTSHLRTSVDTWWNIMTSIHQIMLLLQNFPMLTVFRLDWYTLHQQLNKRGCFLTAREWQTGFGVKIFLYKFSAGPCYRLSSTELAPH